MNVYVARAIAFVSLTASAAFGGAVAALAVNVVLSFVDPTFASASSFAPLAIGAGFAAILSMVSSSFLSPFRNPKHCARMIGTLGLVVALFMILGAIYEFQPTVRAIAPLVATILVAFSSAVSFAFANERLLPRLIKTAYANVDVAVEDDFGC